MMSRLVLLAAALCLAQTTSPAASLEILFVGDRGPHQPFARAQQILPAMAAQGIDITYTEELDDLNAAVLARYDGLIVYADQPKIAPGQEKALLDCIADGKGLVAIHCASSCFTDSPDYTALLGGQFQYHGCGIFRARGVNANHAIMRDLGDFETWDETYVHTKLTQDRTVLQVRREDNRDEPWIWVRSHGKGRVFYTGSLLSKIIWA